MLESDTHGVGVLVVELVDACVVHNISGDDEVGEVGHGSGALSMLHCGSGYVVVCLVVRWFVDGGVMEIENVLNGAQPQMSEFTSSGPNTSPYVPYPEHILKSRDIC